MRSRLAAASPPRALLHFELFDDVQPGPLHSQVSKALARFMGWQRSFLSRIRCTSRMGCFADLHTSRRSSKGKTHGRGGRRGGGRGRASGHSPGSPTGKSLVRGCEGAGGGVQSPHATAHWPANHPHGGGAGCPRSLGAHGHPSIRVHGTPTLSLQLLLAKHKLIHTSMSPALVFGGAV